MRSVSSLAVLILTMMVICCGPASAKHWVEMRAFSRFTLYIDVDSIVWSDADHAELFQMTVLTEEGRRYFQESYEGLGVPDVPPYAVVTWECYRRERRRKTRSRIFLDEHGQVVLRSDQPTPYEDIARSSLYDVVWLYLFERPREEQTFRYWHRQMHAQGLVTV